MTTTLIPAPVDAKDIGVVMTNFDHSVDGDIADKLKSGNYVADYTGWNFCGYVWWDANAQTYRCTVLCYHEPVMTVSGTLAEIMEQVSDEYGWS